MATAREVDVKIQLADQLTLQQQQLIIGTLLGDGCLLRSRNNQKARLQVRHTIRHKEYVMWKYKIVHGLVKTKPRFDPHNNSFYFRTRFKPYLKQLCDLFYPNGNNKVIPQDIEFHLKTPLALTVWLMDDGNGYQHYSGFRISTYGYSKKDNVILQSCLKTNFGLKTSLCLDQKGYQLLILSESSRRLREITQPYQVPCMKYKFLHLTP